MLFPSIAKDDYMEIHENSLTGYKADKSSSSGSVAGNVSAENVKVTGKAASGSAPFNSGNQQQELKEGQVIRGRILDLRYNEVRILLEPEGKILTADLTGGITLSIGQEAQFMVTEYSLSQIVLKYISPDSQAFTDDTILKALTASSLPDSEQNRALVRTLLSNQLPIDRQTLKELARIMTMNREAAPDTIVLLYKNRLPVTPASIRQLEAYHNKSHQIIKHIPALADEISALIRHTEISDKGSLAIIKDVPADTGLLLKDIFTARELTLLDDTLEEAINTATAHEQSPRADKGVRNGSMTLAAAARCIIRLFGSDASPDTLQDTQSAILKSAALQEALSGYTASGNTSSLVVNASVPEPAAFKEDGTVSIPNGNEACSGSFGYDTPIDILKTSSAEESDTPANSPAHTPKMHIQAALTNHLTVDAGKVLLKILDYYEHADSNLSVNKDIISYLIQRLSPHIDSSPEDLSDMPKLHAVIEHALRERWTIKPKDLSEKDPLVRLYKNLNEDLNQLESLVKRMNSDSDIRQPDENIRNIQENLRFMKDLNELLSYVQLPVQFKDKDIHGDFYVYNKIKASKEYKDGLSALLHLELSNIGQVDIHIKMMLNHIQATFCLKEDEAGKIIAEHLPELINALLKKGYHLQARVEKTAKSDNLLEDVLGIAQPSVSLQRYSFDIRV